MYASIGVIVGVFFSLAIMFDTFFVFFQLYKCWLEDEKLQAKTYIWDPILKLCNKWGLDWMDVAVSTLIRVVAILVMPCCIIFLWAPVIVIGGLVMLARYHKYMLKLKRTAGLL